MGFVVKERKREREREREDHLAAPAIVVDVVLSAGRERVREGPDGSLSLSLSLSLARSLAQGSTGSKGYSRRGRIFSFEELSDDFSSVCAGHVTGVKRGHVSARGRAR